MPLPTGSPSKKEVRKKERVSRYAPADSASGRSAVRERPEKKSQTERKAKESQRGRQRKDKMANEEGESSEDEAIEEMAHTIPIVDVRVL